MDDNSKHPLSERKVKFKKNIVGSKRENIIWSIVITLLSFLLSASLSFASNEILYKSHTITAFFVVFVIVFIGIIFDIIGIAVTAADETPFHAMASRKYNGAKQAIKLIRNANKVSSFCNDVVGDICGVISGTASATIVLRISSDTDLRKFAIIGLIASGLVAATTVGGKAIGKTFAISKSNYIVYKIGVLMQFFTGKIKVFKLIISGNAKNVFKK